jgi:hypothetical protein
MNFKVNVDVQLNRARVELTPEQTNSVEQHIEQLLTGDKPTRRAYGSVTNRPTRAGRPLGARGWNAEEERQFLSLYKELSSTGKSQAKIFKLIGQRLGRTDSALLMRLSTIRNGKGNISAMEAPAANPNKFPSHRQTDAHPGDSSPAME